MSDDYNDPFAINNGDDDFDQDYESDSDTTDSDDEFGVAGEDVPFLTDDDEEGSLSNEFHEPEQHSQPQPAQRPSMVQEQSSSAQLVSKPFLKTPIGLAVAGISVLFIGVSGYAVMKFLSGDQSIRPGYGSDSALDAPLTGPTGDLNFNATTPIMQAAIAKVSVDTPSDQIAPQLIESVEVLSPDTATVEQKTEAMAIRLPEEATASAQLGINKDEFTQLKLMVNNQRDELDEIKALLAGLDKGISKVSIVAEHNQAELKKTNTQVSGFTDRLLAVEQILIKQAEKSEESKRGVSESANNSNKNPVKQVEITPENPKAEGRTRIPDLMVMETVSSGKMAIVKKPSNGRVFTLFKGERLLTIYGHMKVSEMKDDGYLILVGEKHYIDKTSIKAVKQYLPKPSARVVKSNASAVTTNTKGEPVRTTTSSYTLNAVYDNGTSFGVVNEKGEFKTYKLGQSIPGLGVISGLDKEQNLVVGNIVIKTLY